VYGLAARLAERVSDRWASQRLRESTPWAEDLRAVAVANLLRAVAEMREQHPRVTDVEWLQFAWCRWGLLLGRHRLAHRGSSLSAA
jgi:hypothetical protein